MLNALVQGSGPAIVLLHPVGLDASSWEEVATRLDGMTVVRVDLRGHGSSPPAAPSMTLHDYAGDVAELIGSLGLAPVVLAGLSFGGMVAQTVAIEFPKLLRGLVVAGCPCDFNDAQRRMLRERGTKALNGGMQAVVAETIARWFSPEFIASGGAEPVRRRLLSDDPKAWATAWSAIAGLETRPRLGSVRVPTVCIAGERDAASPVEAVQQIAMHVPDARFVVLPGASHMMHIETPDLFVGEIRRLLDRLP